MVSENIFTVRNLPESKVNTGRLLLTLLGKVVLRTFKQVKGQKSKFLVLKMSM
jgi:hypothetical protein